MGPQDILSREHHNPRKSLVCNPKENTRRLEVFKIINTTNFRENIQNQTHFTTLLEKKEKKKRPESEVSWVTIDSSSANLNF